MIRRETNDGWLLISQVDHAVLAAEVAGAWGNDAVPELPVRDELLRTIRLHDDGWYDWESAPTIDPATGRPRDFTEMPMAEATAIWTKSIDVAARGEASHAEAIRRPEASLGSSRARRSVAGETLDFDSRFSLRELHEKVAAEVGLDDLPDLVDELVAVDVLQRFDAVPLAESRVFEVAVRRHGEDALGGTWVSRHFAHLAEHAHENRDDPEDVQAAERFLAEQKRRRAAWRPALEAFAGDDADRLAEGGYRLLRFFDWVSLWICCGERETGTDMKFPGGPTIRFEPDGKDRFRLDPWPLAVDRLALAVPVRRLSDEPLADDADLRERLEASPRVELAWELLPV